MGLGVLFVVLVVHAGRAKLNPEKVAKLHKRITDFASSNPLQVFLAGIGVQVTALKSLAFLVVALKQITDAELGIVLSRLTLLLYLVIRFCDVRAAASPVSGCPQKAATLVGQANTWLQDHNKVVTVLVDLFIAYLLFKAGISGWLQR